MLVEKIPERDRDVRHCAEALDRTLPQMPDDLRTAERLFAVLHGKGSQHPLGL